MEVEIGKQYYISQGTHEDRLENIAQVTITGKLISKIFKAKIDETFWYNPRRIFNVNDEINIFTSACFNTFDEALRDLKENMMLRDNETVIMLLFGKWD